MLRCLQKNKIPLITEEKTQEIKGSLYVQRFINKIQYS